MNLMHGDCLEIMKTLPECSVDAVITDPPYGLSEHTLDDAMACISAWMAGTEYRPNKRGFMGRSWDAWVPGPEVWRECLRVLKPGGHLLAFAGTRSMDLMCMAVRLAGFEIRDSIGYAHDVGDPLQAPLLAWTFGSGFPKSRNLEGDWRGFGTALKPAFEPIILARKSLLGTLSENVHAHGTGALNIDACRIQHDETLRAGAGGIPCRHDADIPRGCSGEGGADKRGGHQAGRWPANLIHDGSDEVLALFPQSNGQQGAVTGDEPSSKTNAIYRSFNGRTATTPRVDTGSAARFFYCAKASRADREEGLNEAEDRILARSCQAQAEARRGNTVEADGGAFNKARIRKNNHPTVKPTDLMRYLCRLVTPPGGVVLDPFMGSGSTGKAAALEGFGFIGIELDEAYIDIARLRIARAVREYTEDNRQLSMELTA